MVFDAIRTPRGRGKASGSLHEVKPISLLTGVLKELQARHDLDTAQVDDVVMGCVTPVGEQGSCIAKTAALARTSAPGAAAPASALPPGSSEHGRAEVASGWEDLVVAGAESMSRAARHRPRPRSEIAFTPRSSRGHGRGTSSPRWKVTREQVISTPCAAAACRRGARGRPLPKSLAVQTRAAM
jgi:acetyl-CoA acetyltransferase